MESGYCREFYEGGCCRYGGACKFAHVRREGARTSACPECRRDVQEMCMPDCGHPLCLECAMSGFSDGGRCRRCGEETDGRFFVL